MALALKRYKDGTYIPLFNPTARRIDYGATNKDISRYPANAQKSIKAGLKNGSVSFENTDEGGEYISNPKKKKTRAQRYQDDVKAGTYKKNFVDKFVDRVLSR